MSGKSPAVPALPATPVKTVIPQTAVEAAELVPMSAEGAVVSFKGLFAGDGKFTVDARALHKELGVQTDFRHWVDRNFGDFVEGEDYVKLERSNLSVGEDYETRRSKVTETHLDANLGGRPAKDYLLTPFMAKHLCQLARTDRGKQIRTYLIQCEEKLTRIAVQPALSREERLAQGLLAANEVLAEQRALIDDLSERIAKHKRLYSGVILPNMELAARLNGQAASFRLTMSETAKLLGLRRSVLFERFRLWGWIYKNKPEPMQYAIDRGYVELHVSMSDVRSDGVAVPHPQAMVRVKGLAAAVKKLREAGDLEYSDKVKTLEAAVSDCLNSGDGAELSAMLNRI